MSFEEPVNDLQKARINREPKNLSTFMNNLSDESIDLLLVVKRKLDAVELGLNRSDVDVIHDGHLSEQLHLKQRSAAMMIMLAIALKSIDDFNDLIKKAHRASFHDGMIDSLLQFKLEATKFASDIKTSLEHVNAQKISEAISAAQNQVIPDFVSRIHYFHGKLGQSNEIAPVRPLFNS